MLGLESKSELFLKSQKKKMFSLSGANWMAKEIILASVFNPSKKDLEKNFKSPWSVLERRDNPILSHLSGNDLMPSPGAVFLLFPEW